MCGDLNGVVIITDIWTWVFEAQVISVALALAGPVYVTSILNVTVPSLQNGDCNIDLSEKLFKM